MALARAVLVAVLLVAGPCASSAAEQIDVELVGFLVRLPAGGLLLPPASPSTARLEVPNPQGGSRITFTVEFAPRTEVVLTGGRARDGQLVMLDGYLHGERIRAHSVREIDGTEVTGRLSLRGGPLTLPVQSDRVVDVFLDGALTMPVGFLLTPHTSSRLKVLRDGQAVTLTVPPGLTIVMGVD